MWLSAWISGQEEVMEVLLRNYVAWRIMGGGDNSCLNSMGAWRGRIGNIWEEEQQERRSIYLSCLIIWRNFLA